MGRGNGFFKNPHPGFYNKEQGRWYCDCINGPQPAIRLQVKKEGPNQGRFFYTCREPRDLGAVPGQCGFFLWEETAQEREKKAESRPVQHSEYVPDFASRERMPRLPWFPPYGEGLHFVDEPYFGCYEVEDYGWAPDSTVDDDLDSVKVKKEDMDDSASGLSAIKPSKRKRPAMAATTTMREEKEYGDLESDEERQLVRILESNPPHPSQEQQRMGANVPAPALSQARTSNTTTGTAMPHPGTRTPNPQRTYDASASMLTPTSRGNTTTSASEPGAAKRVKLSDTRGPSPPSPPSTTTKPTTSTNLSQTQGRSYQTTPTGDGIGRPTTTTTTGPGSCDDYEITTSILSLLSSEKGVSDATRQAIRDKLNTYALRMRGVERGRDMTRAALKAREAKEVELKARIEELERERKVAADKVRALRDGLGELFGDVDGCVDGGEGRA
ncbi:hypothetical protein NEUTE2DRAFT_100187 [Neurospora tetrasperma FGSC 2509]|nr:hypothetical protein NEUTE2DRAFT_100187 [Neurospora tetrasperma FGSC 2509]